VLRHGLSTYGRWAFAVAGPMVFNALPDDLRNPSVSTAAFGQLLKMHLFSAYQHVMRYINLRYLLTYALCDLISVCSVCKFTAEFGDERQ